MNSHTASAAVPPSAPVPSTSSNGSRRARRVTVTVCKPRELGTTELELWRSWQREDSRLSSPFLSPEFSVAYSRHREAARVGVLEDGGSTVGFFPFEQQRRGIARSLAFGFCDYQAVISSPELEWDGADLLAATGLAVFDFDHLIGHQAARWSPRTLGYHSSPVIDLSSGYQGWLAEKRRSASTRVKKALQNERRLERELGESQFVFDSRSEQDLRQLMDWKGAQYVRTGRQNPFAQPWFVDFVHEMFAARHEHFALAISRLDAGGRTVALHLSLRGERVLSGWFPTYDPALSRYSPGITYWLSLVRAGGEHGVDRIELGSGDAEYKQLFGTTHDTLAEGSAQRPLPAAHLHRLRGAPRRLAINLILSNPVLHEAARKTLRLSGSVRSGRGASR